METLKEIEKRIILERYEYFGKCKMRTAKSLGISRAGMYRKLNEYGVL